MKIADIQAKYGRSYLDHYLWQHGYASQKTMLYNLRHFLQGAYQDSLAQFTDVFLSDDADILEKQATDAHALGIDDIHGLMEIARMVASSSRLIFDRDRARPVPAPQQRTVIDDFQRYMKRNRELKEHLERTYRAHGSRPIVRTIIKVFDWSKDKGTFDDFHDFCEITMGFIPWDGASAWNLHDIMVMIDAMITRDDVPIEQAQLRSAFQINVSH